MAFRDRADAGRRLAAVLTHFAGENPVVEGLPRGGVPVAFEVAAALGAPLDVLLVRKLGCPGQPELGLGAIGEGGVRVVNDALVARLGIPESTLDDIAAHEGETLSRRLQLLRGDRDRVPVAGRTVIVIDDGLATGYTARAAIEVMRRVGARKVVLAVPVAPADAVEEMRAVADDVVCLLTPAWFMAIGEFYDDFSQVPDDQVARLLARSGPATAGGQGSPTVDPATGDPAAGDPAAGDPNAPDSRAGDPPAGDPGTGPSPAGSDDPGPQASAAASDELPGGEDDVDIPSGSVTLPGRLARPRGARGTVVFAHGSGSSRNSPRNRAVAATLNAAGAATLLLDLLTEAESADSAKTFDIGLLAGRLLAATQWVRGHHQLGALPIGYFGASTGAAAALVAAAEVGPAVAAVMSRGGRPDLAGDRLAEVAAPTLLIVGGDDRAVLELNRAAAARLRDCRLEVVPGATHLFEEPGALNAVAALAASWFDRHFRRAPGAPGGTAGTVGG